MADKLCSICGESIVPGEPETDFDGPAHVRCYERQEGQEKLCPRCGIFDMDPDEKICHRCADEISEENPDGAWMQTPHGEIYE